MAIRFLYLFIFLSLYFDRSLSDPRATEAALICKQNSTAAMADRQVFVANFLATMDALSPQVSTQMYGTAVNGSGNTTVYAFGECMKDLSQTDCNLCFAQIKTQILRCLPFQRMVRGGRLFYDGCYLRYDDHMFFNESLSLVDRTVCGLNNSVGSESVFAQNVDELVKNLTGVGVLKDGFAVGFVNRGNLSVYGLAQCWEFVNGSSCDKCLSDSVSKIGSCVPKDEGRVLNAGCYLRYSTKKFYDNSTIIQLPNNGGGNHLAIVLASTLSSLALVLIIAATAFLVRQRLAKKKRERKQLGVMLAVVNKSKLNVSYEALERATNYFNDSNKLGQGGSGSVYKGTLQDGEIVAIKRLFFNTRQWVDHFFNEVNLISGIHHKNLVKLLGCSITGPESLLIYEYVPNGNLNSLLFGRSREIGLRWEMRFKIILGTAEGLAYLHEESNLRIIHRDVKLSNVLLEADYTPKIADFGLARLFPEDMTHISTGIAGTLGYMAPEYVVRGKLTEKVDVYGFGVLLIEVVCGKKNASFGESSFSILQTVWRHYETRTLVEVIDGSMDGEFEGEDICRVLQIGLLCVQASAELRPSMSNIVKMLKDEMEMPEPTQPPFLNSSSAEFGPSVKPEETPKNQSYTQSSGNSLTQSWIEPR
ncbi:cysteine-rich receptor-like protein kinase 3 [Impatiens glandulifera]|uniref:cysteine-rich receptor-like protein kinase 3 n=1 Tax=Impatiens glandulifera TaxID=253017 RepID=UPI001FB0B911|nr:cysteine-rich receptor-like protein kinase 3 [Impatiens glandulifera]